MSRTVILGGPRTGKTTLSQELRRDTNARLMHTDDLICMGWSEASAHVAQYMIPLPGPWIIEGVAGPRALRKWLRANPTGAPCDVVICRWTPFEDLTPGQLSTAKGCRKVWLEVEGELRTRGVAVLER